MVAAAGVGCWAWAAWRRRTGEQPQRHPKRLFDALCRAHGLDRNQRRSIVQLAEHYQLPQPGILFLQPERFAAGSLSGFGGSLNEIKALHESAVWIGTNATDTLPSLRRFSICMASLPALTSGSNFPIELTGRLFR